MKKTNGKTDSSTMISKERMDQLILLRDSLSVENRGGKFAGKRSMLKRVKAEFNLKGSRETVLRQFDLLLTTGALLAKFEVLSKLEKEASEGLKGKLINISERRQTA